MKVVIDIPEEIYKAILNEVDTKVNTTEHIPYLVEIISNGIPIFKKDKTN